MKKLDERYEGCLDCIKKSFSAEESIEFGIIKDCIPMSYYIVKILFAGKASLYVCEHGAIWLDNDGWKGCQECLSKTALPKNKIK